MRPFPSLFRICPALPALLLAALAVTAPAYAATDPRPLGTLWLDGQSLPPAPQPAPAASPAPVASPPPSYAYPARKTPAVGASTEKPLGTLFRPAPSAGPVQAPLAPIEPLPPLPPASSGPVIQGDRPLGVLWQPGPADFKPVVPAQARPAAQPSPPPLAPPSAVPPVAIAPGRTPERPLGNLLAPPIEPALPSAPPSIQPSADEPPGPASPPGEPPVEPVGLIADEMNFDRERNLVTARGNVEVTHGSRTLIADSISYDQKTDVVTALGNVVLREPKGETIFGDKMRVSGDLKDAVITNIGIILTDRSRIAGTGARRSAGKVTEMRNAIYSPCNLCDDDPNRPPLWQIKAVKVIHDQDQKVVEYRDAWLEMFGFPVLYTPYFRHPDPTVKRKSGLLFPNFGNSSDLGTVLEVPYFWNISPHEDMTVRPIITTEEGAILALEYRKYMKTARFIGNGSITNNSDDDNIFATEKGSAGLRGHIDAETRLDINDTWRVGADVKRASDDTYMRRFGFGGPQSLNSRLFTEGFRGQNYFSANTYAFQGLEAGDVQDEIPIVLPLLDFNHVGKRDRWGGQTSLDVNFLGLWRQQGTDTRRLSIRPRWDRPFQGAFGDLLNLSLKLDADAYHVNSLSRSNHNEDFSGFSHRLHPIAALDWRLPFIKRSGKVSQVLEPIASAIWSPNGGNSTDIPNEDSQELEFDETNLFNSNRFSGLDRVEGGFRINYGMKWSLYGDSGGATTFFLGQSYRPRTDDTFAEGSGLEDNFSDFVGAVDIRPNEFLNALYRTRFAKDNLSPNRQEFTVSAGIPAFRASGTYTFLERQQGSQFGGREELSVSANSKLNRFWRAGLTGRADIDASEMRSFGLQVTYENECVVFTTQATRTFFEDRDLQPTDAITFKLVLKTIGEAQTGFTASN